MQPVVPALDTSYVIAPFPLVEASAEGVTGEAVEFRLVLVGAQARFGKALITLARTIEVDLV